MDNASNIMLPSDDNHTHNNHDHHKKHHHTKVTRGPTRRFSLFNNTKPTVLPVQDDIQNHVDNQVTKHYVTEYFESIVNMVEPMEFYTVRQKAAPKAPSHIRIGVAFLLFAASIAIFALIVSNSLQTFTTETDIFRKLPDLNDWDNCEPITTLGSNWTPFTLYVKDDTNFKQIRYYLHNMWFHNTTSCQDTLGPSWKKFCTLEIDGGSMFNSTGTKPQHSYASAMCGGKNLDWESRGAAADCHSNYIEIWIKYWVPTTGNYFEDCGADKGYVGMCSAIVDSTNPYKCTRKTFTSLVDSLSNGYAFATLAFSIAVIAVTVVFPIFFHPWEVVEIEA